MLRQTADSKALDDQSIISFQKKVGGRTVLPRCQLQKGHFIIQSVRKSRYSGTVLADIPQQYSIPQNPQIRIVDAGKCLKTLCAGLAGPCAQNHVIVEHDRHSGEIRGGTAKSVRHVDLGICGIKSDRLLCTGENHRFWTALDQIAETCGCISHGVCTMGDDKAIIAVIVFPDAPHHIQPMLRAHVSAVQIQKLYAFYIADTGDGGEMVQ